MLVITKEDLLEKLKSKSTKEIAEEMNCSVHAIRHRIRKYGIKRARNEHRINKDYFKTWSSNMAYILGFIYADGSITKSKKINRAYLAISLQIKDIEILEFIKKEIAPKNSIYTYYRDQYDKNYGSATIMICSKEICNDLEALGCIQNKTYEGLKFPDVPKEYIADFIRGFFDGDGSIYISKNSKYNKAHFKIVSSSKDFLIKIMENIGCGKILLEHKGPKSKIDLWSINTGSKIDVCKIFNFLYNNNFCLLRKFEKFKEAINRYE